MRIKRRGKTHRKAEKAKLETRFPALSSPNFFMTPNTRAAGPNRCCAASIRRMVFSTGFTALSLQAMLFSVTPSRLPPYLRLGCGPAFVGLLPAGMKRVHPLVDDCPLQRQPGQPVFRHRSAPRPWARRARSSGCRSGSCSHTWRARTIRSNPAWATTTTPSAGIGIEAGEDPVGAGREHVGHQRRRTSGIGFLMTPQTADGPLAAVRGPVGSFGEEEQGVARSETARHLRQTLRHHRARRRSGRRGSSNRRRLRRRSRAGSSCRMSFNTMRTLAVVPRQQEMDQGEGVARTTVAGQNEHRIHVRQARSCRTYSTTTTSKPRNRRAAPSTRPSAQANRL